MQLWIQRKKEYIIVQKTCSKKMIVLSKKKSVL